MFKNNAKPISRMAIMAALYVLLTMVSVKAGNLHITFASLPVVVSALLFGPWEAAVVALLGEFLNQMLAYGFTVTTLLWLIPPAIRGVTVGLVGVWYLKTGRPLERRPLPYYATCILAAILTTAGNTACIYVDSLIYHYYTPAVIFGDLTVRFFTGMVTAVAVAAVAQPITYMLRKQGLPQKRA